MRKILISIIIAGLLFTITGCKNEYSPATNTASPTQPSADTAPEEVNPIKQIPIVSVSLPLTQESYVAEDKTVIYTITHPNIHLITTDPEVADKIIVDYLNQTEKFASAASMEKQAQEAYRQKTANIMWLPYSSQITYTPTRIDQGVLSLFGNNLSYTGGAHGNIIGHSLNYDLVSGQRLSLADILTPSINPEYISSLIINSLSSQENLFPDYQKTVAARFNSNLLQDEDWYLTNSGLCFFFSPYEIASFASGTISAEIPYSMLTGTLMDAYFPAERESAAGNVQISPFDEGMLDKYSQFAEVVLNENTNKFLLHSEKGVYDVFIETGSWSSDGSYFTAEHTVFACYALAPGDALMIDCDLNTGLPSLRLSYTTAGKTVRYYIQSNGGYSLIPAEG